MHSYHSLLFSRSSMYILLEIHLFVKFQLTPSLCSLLSRFCSATNIFTSKFLISGVKDKNATPFFGASFGMWKNASQPAVNEFLAELLSLLLHIPSSPRSLSRIIPLFLRTLATNRKHAHTQTQKNKNNNSYRSTSVTDASSFKLPACKYLQNIEAGNKKLWVTIAFQAQLAVKEYLNVTRGRCAIKKGVQLLCQRFHKVNWLAFDAAQSKATTVPHRRLEGQRETVYLRQLIALI